MRTLPPTCAPSPRSLFSCPPMRPRLWKFAARYTCRFPASSRSTGVRWSPGKEPSSTRATVRRVASGNSIPSVTAKRPLAMFCYSAAETAGGWQPRRHSDVMAALGSWGLPTNRRGSWQENLEGCAEYVEALLDDRDSLNYAIDGAVIKVDDLELRPRLGQVTREAALGHRLQVSLGGSEYRARRRRLPGRAEPVPSRRSPSSSPCSSVASPYPTQRCTTWTRCRGSTSESATPCSSIAPATSSRR